MCRPLVLILIIFATGIVIEYFIRIPAYLVVCAALIMAAMAGAKRFAVKGSIKVCIYAAVLLCGIMICRLELYVLEGNIDFLSGNYTVLVGTVVEEPDRRIDRINYVLRTETINYYIQSDGTRTVADFRPKGCVLISVKGPGPEFGYGDRVQVVGLLQKIEDPGNPGEFNYKKYLEDRGIRLVFKSRNGAGLTKIGTGSVNFLMKFSISLKDKLTSVINKNMPQKQAALVEGILFGNTGRIDPEIKEDMSLTGVAHLLSVSGYHVGLVAGFIILAGNILGLRKPVRDALTISGTGLYALMAGAGPAVTRALIMAWVLLLAAYCQKEYDWPSSMSLAGLIILIINPLELFDPGFQLSFLATWGILCLVPIFKGLNKMLPPIGQASSVAVGAQIAVFPVTAYYFNYFSLVFLPANLIIVPLISIVMLLAGTAAVMGLLWNPPAEILSIAIAAILEVTLLITGALAGLHYAVINVKPPGIIKIACYYLVLGLFMKFYRNYGFRIRLKRLWFLKRSMAVLTILAVSMVLLWGGIAFSESKTLEITFIDVGQGDAALVQTPGGRNLLIDTGGVSESFTGFDVGERIVLPFLKRKGVREIDVLVLSHPHLDHIQGTSALLGKVKIKTVIVAPQFAKYMEGAELKQKLLERNIEIKEVSRGEYIYFGENIILEILSPDGRAAVNANDDSLIIRLGYRNIRAIFTGDAETVPLAAICNSGQDCRADIVKIPHHGSLNAWTEDFYKTVDPELAVISVGQNLFGHPSPQVLEGLEQMKIRVVRTDRDGAVTVRTDGNSYKVTTVKGMN
ncbi:DNA internalization-related competence protein ComEC/Rec2 [Phosphitispora sp. TUW77]|uniref:DNA internalization-related competence protein ComEC/Rec2 n=1 Tax=Phosphitispora sp. TUW77 TaxID=3152361 RepID=UPI003AB55E2B